VDEAHVRLAGRGGRIVVDEHERRDLVSVTRWGHGAS